MGYQSIPMATQAAGQNNTQGGFNPNQAWNGNGMSLNSAQRLLNPAGFGGHGGLDVKAAGAFLDPLGIDSSSMGLNLFGGRPDPNAGANATFPNLGAASMIPQMPGGGFQALHNGTGAYNNMAAMGAGGMTFNPSRQSVMPQTPNLAMHQVPNGIAMGNKPTQLQMLAKKNKGGKDLGFGSTLDMQGRNTMANNPYEPGVVGGISGGISDYTT